MENLRFFLIVDKNPPVDIRAQIPEDILHVTCGYFHIEIFFVNIIPTVLQGCNEFLLERDSFPLRGPIDGHTVSDDRSY